MNGRLKRTNRTVLHTVSFGRSASFVRFRYVSDRFRTVIRSSREIRGVEISPILTSTPSNAQFCAKLINSCTLFYTQ